MARIRLLHWKGAEAGKYLIALAAAGHTVEYDQDVSSASLQAWRVRPPQAFVIDLYCEFSKLRGSLRNTLSAPPVEPAVPGQA